MATTDQMTLALDYNYDPKKSAVIMLIAQKMGITKLIQLTDNLRKNGFNYTKVLRVGRKCIYEQSVPPNLKYYEVFKVQDRPEAVIHGNILPAREVFPGNEDFGNTAWSCRTLADAKQRFDKLKG